MGVQNSPPGTAVPDDRLEAAPAQNGSSECVKRTNGS